MGIPKVIIIGGGFGGINAALALSKAKIDLLVIDKTNHHLFQPLLYQVATAAISESNISMPIREILRKQSNTTVMMGDVVAIDKQDSTIKLLDGTVLPYDYLILAVGAITSYFGHDEWKPFVHGLKSLYDAVNLRERILLAFENAETRCLENKATSDLRFVVIGGGPTGVEMAGAIAEITQTTLFYNFKKIKPQNTEIYLIEGTDYLLPSFPLRLSIQAKKDLEKLGIKVMTNAQVTQVTSNGIYIGENFIESHTVIWAAGNQASPLLKTLDVPLDRQRRVLVEPDLSLSGYSNVFVIGDAAAVVDRRHGPLPALAPVAIQQGKYVAKIISENRPKERRVPFKYIDKGQMATIGKHKAVAKVGRFMFWGFLAWFVWCLIHILYLISFRNRFIVMIQWFFLYVSDKRNACSIIHSIEEFKD